MTWTRRRVAVAALWGGALAVSVLLYWSEHALVHFAWHLGYGAAAGLLSGAAWTLWRREPAPVAELWALGGYLYMIVPDLLWLAPKLIGRPPWPHQPWMDVFLGHYSLDAWPLATEAMVPVLAMAGAVWWGARRWAGRGDGGLPGLR